MASLSGKYTFFAYISASYMVNIYFNEFRYILTRGFYVKSLLIDKKKAKMHFAKKRKDIPLKVEVH